MRKKTARKLKNEIYPNFDIIKKIVKNEIPFTIGSDSHHPYQVGDHIKKTLEDLKDLENIKFSLFRKRKKTIIDLDELRNYNIKKNVK